MSKIFDKRIAALRDFITIHRGLGKLITLEPKLYNWLRTQQLEFRNDKLDMHQEAMIDEMNYYLPYVRVAGSIEDVNYRLSVLDNYRTVTGGDIPTKRDENKEWASFAQWLTRQKRAYNGGRMPQEIVDLLQAAGINLGMATETQLRGAVKNEIEFFEMNISSLKSYLDSISPDSNDVAFRNMRYDKHLSKIYRFLEHMILKSRNGVLSDAHKNELTKLKFTMNGKPISEVLSHPGYSKRAAYW